MKRLLPVLICVSLASFGALAQIVDAEGDADIPCIDIASLDVRGDATHLTATMRMSLRPYPPQLVVQGLNNLNEVRLCRQSNYDLLIESAAEGHPVVVSSIAIDRDGQISSFGPASLVVTTDTAEGWLQWRIDNTDLGVLGDVRQIRLKAHASIAPSAMIPIPLKPLSSSDVIADAWQPFILGGEAAALIGPSGGSLTIESEASSLFGTSLVLPPTALTSLVPISIEISTNGPIVGVGDQQGLTRIRIEPKETELSIPGTLFLPANAEQRQLTGGALGLVRYDESTGEWVGDFDQLRDDEHALLGTTSLRSFGLYTIWQDGLFAAGMNGESPTRDGYVNDCLPTGRLVVLLHGWKLPCGTGGEATFGNLRTMLAEETEAAICIYSYFSGNSIRATANGLRTVLEGQISSGAATDIAFIAHSQGGLVARTLLEDDISLAADTDSVSRTVAAKVSKLITAGTPHLGLTSARARFCPSLWQMLPEWENEPQGIMALGINNRLRTNPQHYANLLQKYQILAGWDDRVVEQNSALGESCLDWASSWPVPDQFISTLDYDPVVYAADKTCDLLCPLVPKFNPFPCIFVCGPLILAANGFPGLLAHNDGKGQCVVPGSPDIPNLFPTTITSTIPAQWTSDVTLVHSNLYSRIRGEDQPNTNPPNHNPDTLGIVHVENHAHPAWPTLCAAAKGSACRTSQVIFKESFDFGESGTYPPHWTQASGAPHYYVSQSVFPGLHPKYLVVGWESSNSALYRDTNISTDQVGGKIVVFQAAIARDKYSEEVRLDWAGLTLGFGQNGRVLRPSGSGTYQSKIGMSQFFDPSWHTLYVFADFGTGSARLYLDANLLGIEGFSPSTSEIGRIRLTHGVDLVANNAYLDDIRITVLEEPQVRRITGWRAEPRLPRPMMGIGAATYENYILINDLAPSRQLTVVEVDPVTGGIKAGNDGKALSRATIPFPAGSTLEKNIAVIGSNLFVVGSPNSFIGRLNADGSVARWDVAPGSLYAPGSKALVVFGNTLFLVGGFAAGNQQSMVQSATIDASGSLSGWTERSRIPVPLHDPMAVVAGSRLLVFGGEGPNGSTLNSSQVRGVDILSPNGQLGSWDTQPKFMLRPRPHANYFVLDGTIHVAGGGVNNSMTNSVESARLSEFDTDTNRIESQPLPQTLNELGAVTLGPWAYVIGGNNRIFGGGPQDTIYRALFNQ